MTESPLGIRPDKHLFPTRNRIIAGLVDALVIVEAGEKSGALITAHQANSYSREVFALPGLISSPCSQGTHHLIKTHQAHLITEAHDIAYIMNWSIERQHKKIQDATLNQEERVLITALMAQIPLNVSELHAITKIPMGKIMILMMNLTAKQKISSLPGHQYQLL